MLPDIGPRLANAPLSSLGVSGTRHPPRTHPAINRPQSPAPDHSPPLRGVRRTLDDLARARRLLRLDGDAASSEVAAEVAAEAMRGADALPLLSRGRVLLLSEASPAELRVLADAAGVYI